MKQSATLFPPLAIMLLAMPCHAERVESAQYSPMAGKSASVNSASAFLGNGYPAWNLSAPTLEVDLTAPEGGVKQTGVVWPMPSPVPGSQLPWEPILGGYVARVHLVSGQAKRLRFHLAIPHELKSIQFRVQGNLDMSPLGPIDSSAIQANGIWLPVTNGNTADLEIFVDEATALDTLDFQIDSVNLIMDDFSSGDVAGIVAQSLGYTAYKEYDLACWFSDFSYLALTQAAAATAKVNFIQNGNSFTCSGTLLNDKGSTHTPWFATANHCIADQATANTASFEWFFQAASCGSSVRDPRYAQTYGGATLLYTDFKLEPSFLKLNQAPPGSVSFVGWDTTIQVGQAVWGVHHPEGDHTMASKGTVTALLQTETDVTSGGSHLLDTVTFTQGGTEPGSSGSGLFTVTNGLPYWHGTLFGGPVNNYKIASYSHLQSYYNNIKQWLESTSNPFAPVITFTATPATVDYLGSATLKWSVTQATSCSATTSDGWSGAVGLSGNLVLTMNRTTTYTLTCVGGGATSTQSVTVAVNPPPSGKIACLLDWAEGNYSYLFSPNGAITQILDPYTYRYYRNTKSYVGVSSIDNHVYYLGPDGVLRDEGELFLWLKTSSCQ